MDHAVLETDRHRYVVVSYLAAGGMGAIYRGRRVDAAPTAASLSQEVVLKQLLPEHTADPKRIEMFLREARLSASLSHKNIVRTLDLVNAGEDYYIVMEYVRGGDLRSLLRRAKRRQQSLSLDSSLFIVAEVLAALTYAHDKRSADGKPLGIIHRDVSPSNVLIDASGTVKLTDFGIAKAPTQGSVVFKVKGKVGYMAPEQARGEHVDARTDVFAVGVMLYELLVGEKLFVGNALSPAAVIFAQPIRPPSRRRADVGADLDAIVMRALSLDREGRFASADEMRRALLELGQKRVRSLTESALAADLRRACGDDPSAWLNLDVPPQATLDGGTREGTGVIEMDDSGEFDDRSSLSRPGILPSRELTSIVRLRSTPELEQPTEIQADPFAPQTTTQTFDASDLDIDDKTADEISGQPADADDDDPLRPPDANEFGRDDSGVRTRVQPRALPTRRVDSARSRAVFETPVPRSSPQPPSLASSDAVRARQQEETRIETHLAPVAPVHDHEQDRENDDAKTRVRVTSRPHPLGSPSPAALEHMVTTAETRAPDYNKTYSPSSLAGLERALGGRTVVRVIVMVLGLIVLVGFGIGVGVLLSGPYDDPTLAPAPPTAPQAPSPAKTPASSSSPAGSAR